MIPSRFGQQNQKEPATSRHCHFYRQTELAVFRRQPVRECRPASRRNRRPNPKKRQGKGEINFAAPILQGRLPAVHGKKGIRAKQGKYIFMFAFDFTPRKRLMKTRKKIVFVVIEQNQRIGRCLQQIRLLHDPIFHGSIKIHITLTGFPRLSFVFRRPYIQRPSESLIFRHRDETEWGRESCLNHRHRNQSPVPFHSISICATARNVRPVFRPKRHGGFRRAGGIRPRPR